MKALGCTWPNSNLDLEILISVKFVSTYFQLVVASFTNSKTTHYLVTLAE